MRGMDFTDGLLDKELAGQSHPKTYRQLLNVQMEMDNEWCPSWFCAGTNTI